MNVSGTRVLRLQDKAYIQKKLRTIVDQQIEFDIIKQGRIGAGREFQYCSDRALLNRKVQEEKTKQFMDGKLLYMRETKQVFKLSELSQANYNKASEIMCQINGLKEIAKSRDYKWLFVTLTAPREMHPTSSKYQGRHTPRDSSIYLKKQWKKIRTRIGEIGGKNNNFFGVWSCEAHKSQTMHFHVAIFADKELLAGDITREFDEAVFAYDKHKTKKNSKKILVLRERIRKEYRDTIEAKILNNCRHSPVATKIVVGDDSKSSAVTYITKYVVKSLMSDAEFEDDESKSIKQAVLLWKVRRYGFFGVDNRITLWRELRRIKEVDLESPEDVKLIQKVKGVKVYSKNEEGDEVLESKENPDFKYFVENIKLYESKFEVLKENKINKYGDEYQNVRDVSYIERGSVLKTRFTFDKVSKLADGSYINEVTGEIIVFAKAG